MFDPETVMTNGIPLIVVVFGLVEFFKNALNIQGRAVTILAAVTGLVVMLAYELQAVLPAAYAQVYAMVVSSITFGLAASGYYKFQKALRERSSLG